MLDGLTPDLAPRLVLAIGGVGIALVILVLVLIFLKRRNSPLFIKGGKSREARLMVLDAAAVDPKRRLVLIRRDEVEHLIMIGGPTDIVIETGITDRTKAAAKRSISAEEVAAPHVVAPQAYGERPTMPADERRPEPARPVVAAQPERSADLRPAATAQPVVQPVSRTAAQPAAAQDRVAPAIDRPVERPTPDRQPAAASAVSAMGSVLYGEDREPMSGQRSTAPVIGRQEDAPVVMAETKSLHASVDRNARPLPSAAEAALDAARERVLPNPQATPVAPPVTVADAERALEARMAAMRRVQSAQPAVQGAPQSAIQPVVPQAEPRLEPARPKDAEPSDFEKLLEAELDANGVFGRQVPEIRSDARVTTAMAADAAVPPVRVSPPVTGATPDVTSEEEVARLLGEIAINRKP